MFVHDLVIGIMVCSCGQIQISGDMIAYRDGKETDMPPLLQLPQERMRKDGAILGPAKVFAMPISQLAMARLVFHAAKPRQPSTTTQAESDC